MVWRADRAGPAPRILAMTMSQTLTPMGQCHPFVDGTAGVSMGTSGTLNGPKDELCGAQVS